MVRLVIICGIGAILAVSSQYTIAQDDKNSAEVNRDRVEEVNSKAKPVRKTTTGVIAIETTIVGTKEQPKFLSIVPWRSLQGSVIADGNLRYKLNKQLTAIEPNELQAQLSLHQRLKGE